MASMSSCRAALTLRRHAASSAAAAAGRAPVLVSLVVERNPVVVPESTPFEAAYERYQVELARERAKPFSEDFFTKKTDSKADADAEADERSAEDQVDYALRRTPDDDAGKTDTLNRQLDRTLYFIVRDEQGRWRFPQTQPERSAPLLTEAGEAHVRASYSGAEPPKLYFAGHGPAAVLKRGTGSDLPAVCVHSRQVFFYRSQLLAGSLASGDGAHAWLNRDELRALLPPEYYEAVAPVLSY